jgi:hypothetical protein
MVFAHSVQKKFIRVFKVSQTLNLEASMSDDSHVKNMTVSCAKTSPSINNPDFGFDAEVAADVAGVSPAVVIGNSPPIAVPASKSNQARPNLSVQVAYDPPEFRTVSPPVWEQCSDSPIGGGLMYVLRMCMFACMVLYGS